MNGYKLFNERLKDILDADKELGWTVHQQIDEIDKALQPLLMRARAGELERFWQARTIRVDGYASHTARDQVQTLNAYHKKRLEHLNNNIEKLEAQWVNPRH